MQIIRLINYLYLNTILQWAIAVNLQAAGKDKVFRGEGGGDAISAYPFPKGRELHTFLQGEL